MACCLKKSGESMKLALVNQFKTKSETAIETCYHCGDKCKIGKVRKDEKAFCCSGCVAVYDILKQGNLCTYYDLEDKPGTKQTQNLDYDKFAFLDDEEVIQNMIQFKDESQTHIKLYLPQIHCASCLWLLEHLPQLHPGIQASEVDFVQKEVFIVFKQEEISLKELVTLLSKIGYEPQLNKGTIGEGNQVKKNYTSANIKYLGVAGACFVAIMMLSLPEYISGGKLFSESLSIFFRWANLVLCLPAVFYASYIFFQSAWAGIKHKVLNTDAPVALAIGITFGRSVYDVAVLGQSGYFDSLTGLIFFMLMGRVLQQRTYRLINYERDFTSYFPIAVSKINKDKSISTVKLEDIKFADEVVVYPNDIIPIDGIVVKSKADIDYSFVTGESTPSTKETSDIVYAGGRVLNNKIVVYALKEASQSYLTHLWNKTNNDQTDKKTIKHTDWVSHYFTWGILLIAAITAAVWLFIDPGKALWAATAVLIISCPCALLLSETFTKGNILRNLSKIGLYVKNENVLDQLAHTDHIIFDKTGTLTEAKNFHTIYNGKTLNDFEKEFICSAASHSKHPYSRAITNYFDSVNTYGEISVTEISGGGLEANFDNHYLRLGSEEFVYHKKSKKQSDALHDHDKKTAEVYIMIDEELVGIFNFKNYYRKNIHETLKQLSADYEMSVLSGDNDAEYKNLRTILGKNVNLSFNQKPDDKRAYIHQLKTQGKNTLMVGDGLNDNGALQESDCGLIICEESNSFFPGGDALLDANSVSKLGKILAVAKKIKPIIYLTFGLSLAYNFTGLFFAVQGNLSPLIAAILMPASSITIILLTFGLSEWVSRRKLF